MFLKNLSTLNKYLLSLSAFIFLVFYFILSFYNRIASDDLIFKSITKGRGFFEGMTDVYLTWCGRWSSLGYLSIILSSDAPFEYIHYKLFAHHLITIILLLFSLNKIHLYIFNNLLNIPLSKLKSISYSLTFIAGLYFFTFNHSEVWWWLSASVYYLQGIVFLLLAFALILSKRKNALTYFLIIFSGLYVGASYELYILIIYCLLFFSFLILKYSKYNYFTFLKSTHYYKSFLFFLFSFIISSIIFISSPGNFARRQLYNELIINNSTFSMDIFFQSKYIVAIILSATWLFIGYQSKINIEKFKLKSLMLYTLCSFIISIFVSFLFQKIILYNNSIPLRGWTFTSFILYILICQFFLFSGVKLKKIKPAIIQAFQATLSIILCIILSFVAIKQYQYVKTYSTAYDKLINDLLAHKNEKVYYVSPLPNSGMLTYLYLDSYAMTPLKNILEIKAEVILKN